MKSLILNHYVRDVVCLNDKSFYVFILLEQYDVLGT